MESVDDAAKMYLTAGDERLVATSLETEEHLVSQRDVLELHRHREHVQMPRRPETAQLEANALVALTDDWCGSVSTVVTPRSDVATERAEFFGDGGSRRKSLIRVEGCEPLVWVARLRRLGALRACWLGYDDQAFENV